MSENTQTLRRRYFTFLSNQVKRILSSCFLNYTLLNFDVTVSHVKYAFNLHRQETDNCRVTVIFVRFVMYTVSQKTAQNCFCQNFIKCPPILTIFGRKMAKRLKLCEVYSFLTSSNLCHHTTVLNADVPNRYTML